MELAARIRRIRLQRSVTVEALDLKTGLTKRLLTRIEKGQEVPTLEMLDALAGALDVPVHVFFYDAAEPKLTPRLTPRPALQELAAEWLAPATSLRSYRGYQGRDAQHRTWASRVRRINTEMKLLAAAFFASFR